MIESLMIASGAARQAGAAMVQTRRPQLPSGDQHICPVPVAPVKPCPALRWAGGDTMILASHFLLVWKRNLSELATRLLLSLRRHLPPAGTAS